jgi:anaerobic magnesium-protoporphyrin IX monomethyl ester cyclase
MATAQDPGTTALPGSGSSSWKPPGHGTRQLPACLVDMNRRGIRHVRDERGPVVLVIAPSEDLPVEGFDNQDMFGKLPSIGVLYLAAALEEAGFEAVVLDRLYSEGGALELALEIHGHAPALVGFGISDETVHATRQTLNLLRLIYQGPVVIGGYTPTMHAEEMLRAWPDVDFAVVREGERAVVALAEYIRGERALEAVPNLVYLSGDDVHSNPEHPLLDVTGLAWPSRQWAEPGDVAPIVSRRGCSSRCSFCSMVPFYDRKLGPAVRLRTPADVAAEIAHCISHGAAHFMFYDDCFGLATARERAWCDQFLAEIQSRDLDFTWAIELRVIDVLRGEAQLRRMCEAGLVHLAIGMESLLPRQLALYQKGYKQRDAFEAIEIARTQDCDFQTNVIFWDPWITLEEAMEHVELLGRLGIQDQLASANFPFYANLLTVRKDTGLYTTLKEAGMLRWAPDSFKYEYELQDPDVVAFRRGAHLEFLQRTRRLARPPALWLSVPLLERKGRRHEASALRSFARAIAHTEYEYFRALLEAALQMGSIFQDAAQEIHAHYGPQVDACSGLLPPTCWHTQMTEGGSR